MSFLSKGASFYFYFWRVAARVGLCVFAVAGFLDGDLSSWDWDRRGSEEHSDASGLIPKPGALVGVLTVRVIRGLESQSSCWAIVALRSRTVLTFIPQETFCMARVV